VAAEGLPLMPVLEHYRPSAQLPMLFLRRRPTLEVHIPASPTPAFLNMVHYLTRSLRVNGGRYRDAPVVLTLGAETADPGLARRHPWMADNGVEVRWVDDALYARETYFATACERFRYDFKSDVVLALDADTLIAGPLDQLVDQAHRTGAVCGVVAHVPPFGRDEWEAIYRACGLGQLATPCEHTGWGYMFQDETRRYCPPYFNLGVIAAPAAAMRRIGGAIYEHMAIVDGIQPTIYRAQVGVSLAVTRFGLPFRALPFRWNFVNDPLLEALHASELDDVRIVHLLRTHQGIRKHALYASMENVEAMLARGDLRVINARAQRLLAELHPRVKAECAVQAVA
jgi:hypothetical protein